MPKYPTKNCSKTLREWRNIGWNTHKYYLDIFQDIAKVPYLNTYKMCKNKKWPQAISLGSTMFYIVCFILSPHSNSNSNSCLLHTTIFFISCLISPLVGASIFVLQSIASSISSILLLAKFAFWLAIPISCSSVSSCVNIPLYSSNRSLYSCSLMVWLWRSLCSYNIFSW